MDGGAVITTVVPVKPAERAKQRLSAVLSPADRADLVRALLVRTVTATASLGPVLVVSRSPRMRRLAADAGARPLVEDGEDLDTAVAQGLAATRTGSALVLPADLPAITPAALAGLVAAGDVVDGPHVVVVPCQREEGTNALLLRPPEALAPAFGPGSFRRHVAHARSAGLACTVHRSDAFVDLDLPEDWARHRDDLAATRDRPA